MKRREFIGNLSLGLVAAWAGSRLFWPVAAKATDRPVSLAFLSDAHLLDGHPHRAEARALARAVAEIRALRPAPHLVLFAGDLAHDGNAMALALGQEILSDLTMPVLAVRGEGDGNPAQGSVGRGIFKEDHFVYQYEGINLLGLDTRWQDGPGVSGFALGEAQQRWLSQVLSRLERATPLVVLSHAPLAPIYRPWGQWTRDSGPWLDRLSGFQNVLYIHGHVHCSGCASPCGENGETVPGKTGPPLVGGAVGEGEFFPSLRQALASFTPFPALPHQGGGRINSAWGGFSHISLPATSWPLPCALTGTPRQLRPGLGPRGCGWALFQQSESAPHFRQVLWQA